MKDLQCPQCGAMMELTWHEFHKYRDGSRKPYYRCIRHHEGCSGKHWAHPDGSPQGFPVDEETRKLRRELHELLRRRYPHPDIKKHRMQASFWLKAHGWGGHVGSMDREQCLEAIEHIKTKL